MLGDRSSSVRVPLWFLGTQPSPGDVHARSRGGRTEDGCVGSAVAQTLANVTPSYFKIFILLPSDKNVLWSGAYHLQFGTWWGGGLVRG